MAQQQNSSETEYFEEWSKYILGLEGPDKLADALIKSGVVKDRAGLSGLTQKISAGEILPMDVAKKLIANGISSKDLFGEVSYLWIMKTSYAYKINLEEVKRLIGPVSKEAYEARKEGTFVIRDLGCGAGPVTREIIPDVFAALPQNTKIKLYMEDRDPLGTVTSAMFAHEMLAQFPNRLEVDIKCHDMAAAQPDDDTKTHLVLGLLSMLPYLTLNDQRLVLQRIEKMAALRAILTGHVNDFDAIKYFLHGYEGVPLKGLLKEWGFISKSLPYTKVAIKMTKKHAGVFPNLRKALDLYREFGWDVEISRVFTPTAFKDMDDLDKMRGVVLVLRKK